MKNPSRRILKERYTHDTDTKAWRVQRSQRGQTVACRGVCVCVWACASASTVARARAQGLSSKVVCLGPLAEVSGRLDLKGMGWGGEML